MTDAFGCLGDRETLTYIAPDTVLVTVGTFEGSCTLFVGCQCSGSTLASNGVWLNEVPVCTALAMSRIGMEHHKQCLENDL